MQQHNQTTTLAKRKTPLSAVLTLLYRLYAFFIFLPLFLLASLITAVVTAVGCRLGDGHFWGLSPWQTVGTVRHSCPLAARKG